jgi:hypothetical protein
VNLDTNLEVTAESRFKERTLRAHDRTVRLELAALASNGHVGEISTGKEAMQRCIARGSTEAVCGQLLDLPRCCHGDSFDACLNVEKEEVKSEGVVTDK